MAKESRLEAIRRAVLREWRGGDDPAHPDERLHGANEFVAAILRQAGATICDSPAEIGATVERVLSARAAA